MVTTIHNMTSHMGRIGCSADNGYGTPMQSSRTIQVERRPRIIEPEVTGMMLIEGQDFKYSCIVDAYPKPDLNVGRRIGGDLFDLDVQDRSTVNDLDQDILQVSNIIQGPVLV